MLGLSRKSINTQIRNLHFSSPEYADVKPAKVTLTYNGVPVKIFDEQSLYSDLYKVNIEKRKLQNYAFDGYLFVISLTDKRPFEKETTMEARQQGAADFIAVKTGKVHYSSLQIYDIEKHELDLYISVLIEKYMDMMRRENVNVLETGRLFYAIATGNYEPLYVQAQEIIFSGNSKSKKGGDYRTEKFLSMNGRNPIDSIR